MAAATPSTRAGRAWINLATERLGVDLIDWLRTRRSPTNPHDPIPGWRRLATELTETTGIEISHNALWELYRDAEGRDAEASHDTAPTQNTGRAS